MDLRKSTLLSKLSSYQGTKVELTGRSHGMACTCLRSFAGLGKDSELDGPIRPARRSPRAARCCALYKRRQIKRIRAGKLWGNDSIAATYCHGWSHSLGSRRA